jgi:hypothetical protein
MIADPYGLGTDLLDNTPWWVPGADNRRGTERSLGFCNPFGYEDDDVRVMGGMNDPNREPYHWQCRNYAQGRYWMTCANGHRGRVTLCYGHVWQIQRRMGGTCPRCVWPPRARELDERMNHLMREMPRAWPDERQRMALALEDARHEMDELRQRGTITNGAPLRLEEVS